MVSESSTDSLLGVSHPAIFNCQCRVNVYFPKSVASPDPGDSLPYR